MLKKIGQGLLTLGSYTADLVREIVGLAAVASIAYGAWLIAPAAGFIVGGVLVLAGTVLLAMKPQK